MGIDLKFVSGLGPLVERPIQSEAAVKALTNFDVEQALPFTKLAIEKTKRKLPAETPLLGFVGGPLTLASYAIEGKSSKDLQETKKLFYTSPFTYEALLTHIAKITGEYLALQAKWGCDALVIMDSWAGHLSIGDYRSMALPYTQIVLDKVREITDIPVLHYANGAGHLLPELKSLNLNGIGLDWRTDLAAALRDYPSTVFQGIWIRHAFRSRNNHSYSSL
jgi:uroporphyrinogen decarboxylase